MLEHAIEQKEVLTELCIWNYLSENEISSLCNATNDIAIDRITKTYIDKYWNQMCSDYDSVPDVDDNELVLESNLSKLIKNTLMRAKITDKEEFLDFVSEKGWKSINGFGDKAAQEVFSWIFPYEDKDTLANYIKKYKIIKEDN